MGYFYVNSRVMINLVAHFAFMWKSIQTESNLHANSTSVISNVRTLGVELTSTDTHQLKQHFTRDPFKKHWKLSQLFMHIYREKESNSASQAKGDAFSGTSSTYSQQGRSSLTNKFSLFAKNDDGKFQIKRQE